MKCHYVFQNCVPYEQQYIHGTSDFTSDFTYEIDNCNETENETIKKDESLTCRIGRENRGENQNKTINMFSAGVSKSTW